MNYSLNMFVKAANTTSYLGNIFVGLDTDLSEFKVVDNNEYYLNFNTPKYTDKLPIFSW